MATQETLLSGKRRGPKPTGIGKMIGVRLQPHELQKLDAWIDAQGGGLSRPEAIRRLIAIGENIVEVRCIDLADIQPK